MGGGNEKNNIIKVTGREHYILHLLLMKTFKKFGNKRLYAKSLGAVFCFTMINKCVNRYIIPSKMVELLRIKNAEMLRERYYSNTTLTFAGKSHSEKTILKLRESKIGERNPFYGKKHSEKSKEKMSDRHKGENHHMYGKNHSSQTKEKMSKAKKGKQLTEDHKSKLGCKGEEHPNYGKTLSEETRQKMSQNHWSKNGGVHGMLNSSHKPDSIEKMRINSTKQWWDAYSPEGEYFHKVSLNEMIRKYNLNGDCIRKFKGKIIPEVPQNQKKQAKYPRLNTTGWLFIPL